MRSGFSADQGSPNCFRVLEPKFLSQGPVLSSKTNELLLILVTFAIETVVCKWHVFAWGATAKYSTGPVLG